MQVVLGPRQSGKTTLVEQTLAKTGIPYEYASADRPFPPDRDWIIRQWLEARIRLAKTPKQDFVLVLDEVQKIPQWSGIVKWLWDQDAWHKVPLKIVLLGSAPLLMDKGLSESLTGRFQTLRLPHWSFQEMRDAFGWDWKKFVFFGGYPGMVHLTDSERIWREHVLDAVVETTLSRDVLLHTRVEKPPLLRQLLHLGCEHSSKIVSYTKMLGALEDAGNKTTLANYLDLLDGAWLLAGLQKYHASSLRVRRTVPKLQVFNTALMAVASGLSYAAAVKKPKFWGRLVESAVGAHLANAAACHDCKVYYWRENGNEVDFVAEADGELLAIEVKSGPVPSKLRGLSAFRKRYPAARELVVGSDAVPVDEFLARPVAEWLDFFASTPPPPPGDGM